MRHVIILLTVNLLIGCTAVHSDNQDLWSIKGEGIKLPEQAITIKQTSSQNEFNLE